MTYERGERLHARLKEIFGIWKPIKVSNFKGNMGPDHLDPDLHIPCEGLKRSI